MFKVNGQKQKPAIRIRIASKAELEAYEKYKQAKLLNQISSDRPGIITNSCKPSEYSFRN